MKRKFEWKDFKVLEKLEGSSAPQKVEETKTKKLFVVKKFPNNFERGINEWVSNKIYEIAGARVPKSEIFVPDKLIISEFIEGVLLKSCTSHKNEIRQKMGEFFVVDALLANWDVCGLYNDNIIISKVGNDPYRIDLGGCMRFRALGELKNNFQWGDYVTELFSLKNSSTNNNTANMFCTVDSNVIKKQFEKLKKENFLEKILKIELLRKEDAKILKNRFTYIENSIRMNQLPTASKPLVDSFGEDSYKSSQSTFSSSSTFNNVNNSKQFSQNFSTNNFNQNLFTTNNNQNFFPTNTNTFNAFENNEDVDLQEAIRRSLMDK